MAVLQSQIEAALKEVVDPYLEKDLMSAKVVRNIAIAGDTVTVDVVLGFPAKGHVEQLSTAIKQKVSAIAGVGKVSTNISSKIDVHGVQKGVKAIASIKNIIAVA